jgi:peptidoglycan/xylan/chitin deacetylase (PgdA/CDA1 family)
MERQNLLNIPNLFLHKSNIVFKSVFPKYIWDLPSDKPTIYLTFDDGPIPEVTEFVFEELKKNDAKATFFCIGENVQKNQAIFDKISMNGHSFGNHTYNHLNGWKTDYELYINNFDQCTSVLPKTKLFRPPYGKIRKRQANYILNTHKIIMWDVISGDFAENMSKDVCLEKCIKHTESGTIIVFHDSIKAYDKMSYILPRYIEYFKEKGFSFEPLNNL